MSEVYIEPTYQSNSGTNYSKFKEMREQQTLMFDVIIGIFGAIICLQLLFTCYVFRITINKFCCGRIIRKSGKMIEIGEMSHKIKDEDTEDLIEK
tara:strand:+ start:139 stop:423 length:285 start_codon:yes stop_codon:yes gene_type:complete